MKLFCFSHRTKVETLWGLGFISPWLIGFLCFTLIPVVLSAYYSFTDYNLLQQEQWVGLKNYQTMLTDDVFWKAVSNTVYMILIGMPIHLLAALLIALLLSVDVKGIAIYRAIYYLPVVVPVVASALLWRWMFNPMYGIINTVLNFLRLPEPGWLVDPAWSKPALIIMGLWTVGGSMVLYLAAIKDVPQTLYEAAEIEGASYWQKTLRITLPLISPIIFFNLINGIIGYSQYFTQAYVMSATGQGSQMQVGGPRNSTMFYALYLYINAFRYYKMGFASAMAWMLFLVLLLVTFLLFKHSGWVYYSGATDKQ